MGSWEAIKMDPSLKLEKKILPEDGKPNEKQLQTRAEYLIRHLAKTSPMFAVKEDKFSPKKGRKPKTKAFVEDDSSSDEDKPPPSLINNDHVRQKTGPKPSLTATVVKAEREEDHDEKKKREHKEHKEHKKHHHHHHHHKKNKKKPEPQNSGPGPMHFTTHETVAINVTGELSEENFKECKEKMRPVKKSLKQLGKRDHGQPEKDQSSQTRQCLRLIGDHINSCLMAFHDPEKIREWRSNLWFFVSKFTEYDAPKLYKMYKKAKQKDEDGMQKKVSSFHETQNEKSEYTPRSPIIGTVPLILDRSYLVGKSTSSKIADTKVSKF
jgi:chromodomain-helicase-DNA-binding protein 1